MEVKFGTEFFLGNCLIPANVSYQVALKLGNI